MTISPDILSKAEALCKKLEAMPSEGNIAMIAEALMAERERCAEAARKWLDDTYDHWDPYQPSDLGEDVAAQILASPQPDKGTA